MRRPLISCLFAPIVLVAGGALGGPFYVPGEHRADGVYVRPHFVQAGEVAPSPEGPRVGPIVPAGAKCELSLESLDPPKPDPATPS